MAKQEKHIRDYTPNEFLNLLQTENEEITDTTLMILKGHIEVEYALNCYLEVVSKMPSDFFRERFSFTTKVKMLQFFGNLDRNILKELRLLNSLRNDIAHTLKYDETRLDLLIKEVEMKRKADGRPVPPSDFNKTTLLRLSVAFLGGVLFQSYYKIRDPKAWDAWRGSQAPDR